MRLSGYYTSHVFITIWRRKSTVLAACAGLVFLVLCLQYSSVGSGSRQPTLPLPPNQQEETAKSIRILHRNHGVDELDSVSKEKNVRFVPTAEPPLAPSIERQEQFEIDEKRASQLARQDTPSREDIMKARRKAILDRKTTENNFIDNPVQKAVGNRQNDWNYVYQGASQDGIPIVDIDVNNVYIPKLRVVHLDLKGAPPKLDYLRKIFPILKKVGANAVLLEWEDMFPFKGPLSYIAAKNHYSRKEVYSILELAKQNDFEVIPLVQTFGHLEFALKLPQFQSLREVPEIPQAVCPSRNESLFFIQRMIDQVMAVHRKVRFLHIGCDEVYHMGECNLCRQQQRETLFLEHVARVAKYVRDRYNVTPLIWDDMLRQIPAQMIESSGIGNLVEPMVWVYAEDVYRFVPPSVWDKFAEVFPTVWAASAFKGAFGETLVVPDIRRHLENNLKWLEVMWRESSKFERGFAGLVITGWQRYDHFAVLCELLPAGIPSLTLNLIAASHGYFNQTLRSKFYDALSCTFRNDAYINLAADPYMWDKIPWCFYPGAQFYKLTIRLSNMEREVEEYVTSVTKSKAWLTDFNVRHNFSSPMRLDEALMDFPRVQHSLQILIKTAKDALAEAFDFYTVAEWIEQKIYPLMKKVEEIEHNAAGMKAVRTWPQRPFPPLTELRKYGVPVTKDDIIDDVPTRTDNG